MKNFTKNFTCACALLLLTTMLFTSSCKKDRIEDEPLKAYSPVNTYLDSKKQQEQEFIIDTTGSGPIIGDQGTKIWTGKQCLMFPNGDSVTWPFSVKLVELYKPKDMIYYQMPTVASGEILKTDGEIRLRAFKNGTELVLKPDPCAVQIEMPNAAPQTGMQVFYGFESNGKPDWTNNPSVVGIPTATATVSPLFTNTAYGYQASIAKLGWINCDKLAGSTPSSALTFDSKTDDLTNVGIFIYLPATKTIMQVYNKASGQIPNGAAVKIIAIGIDASGNLFSFYQDKTVSANAVIAVAMSATTDAALTAVLDGL